MNSEELSLQDIENAKDVVARMIELHTENFGCHKSKVKILEFLGRESRSGLSMSQMSQRIRVFGELSKKDQANLLEIMVESGLIKTKAVPSFSGRGRPKTSYFLVAADD